MPFLAPLFFSLLFFVGTSSGEVWLVTSTASERTGAIRDRSIFVKVHGNILTVRAEGVPREDLLREIARQARLKLQILDPLQEESVTAAFSAVPLEEGLRRILQRENFVMVHSFKRRLVEVIVVSNPIRSPSQRDKVPAKSDHNESDEASLKALRQALQNQAAPIREAAVNALEQIGREEVVPLLALALRDQDPWIRQSAAQALGGIGGEQVLGPLTSALRDSHPKVRQSVVRALAKVGGTTVIGLLRQALEDGYAEVQEAAKEALEELVAPQL